jgi:signal transduction histidine kinase
MLVPIRGRDQILGLLTLVSSTDDRRYCEADLSFAEEVGRRAGLAIDNARLFSQAREAVQMRDEFLSIASHELKTPITSLGLQIQMNQRRLQKNDDFFSGKKEVEKLLDTTSKQVDRLSKLIESMLDISRIAHGKLILESEEVDFGFLVKEVVERFHEQLSAAGYKYQLNIESCINGRWDRYRLEQVVTNLITNAMKYGDRKPIKISVFTEENSAVLVVRDHGMGIAQDNLTKIFDRFERAVTGNGISGLGLGLYISRQIAEAHGGKILVESEVGEGSSFRFEIPLSR